MILFLLLSLVVVVQTAKARLHTIELNLTVGQVNPDCYETSYTRLLVNGQHPAPPIRVVKDDEVHIIVRNGIDTGYATVIHYHGILQIGTTEADGMPNVTQAPLQPGEEYHQRFTVKQQIGTYFYHAHVDLQDDVIHGPFIVYESEDAMPDVSKKKDRLREGPYEYDDERILMLSEWWHRSEQERLDYILGDKYNGMVVADSYLLNGRTVYNTSSLLSEHCEGYSAIDVEQGKVYRLRVIGSLTFATLGVAIAKHSMTVIEVDGELVKPYETSYLEVASGQRFSVLLKADQAPESYFIDTHAYYLSNNPETSNGRAILRYVQSPSSTSEEKRANAVMATKPDVFRPHARNATVQDLPVFPPGKPEWIFPSLESVNPADHDFDAPPDRTIVLVPIEKLMPDGTTRWLINDHLPPEWPVPLLYQLAERETQTLNETAIQRNREGQTDGFDDGTQSYPLRYGETVDFVIQATTLLADGTCAGHPWHSHGYTHYAIANGPGAYIHERDKDLRTYPHPIPKDTTFVYPIQPSSNQTGGIPCGWTKVRFFTVRKDRRFSFAVCLSQR